MCPAGIQELHCDPMLCRTKSCPGQKDVTCRVNSCGKCEAEFLDKNGRKVDCKCWSKFLNDKLATGYKLCNFRTPDTVLKGNFAKSFFIRNNSNQLLAVV